MISKISDPAADGVDVDVKQEWGYYTSFKDDDDGGNAQNSGAYIFRPETPDQDLIKMTPDPSKTRVYRSPLVAEVHAGFVEPWIRQIVRIRKGQPYVEVEYSVGPIPVGDGRGREVVARLTSGIDSRGTFYTDSNAREFVRRSRGSRPTWDLRETQPVAGNYYPVNAAVYLEDDRASLSVSVDRSQGGSSLTDGALELMVHRRTLGDDGRGVGEPMNETDAGMSHYPPYGDATRYGDGVVATGIHRIMIGGGGGGASSARSLMDGMFSPPHLFATTAPTGRDLPFQSSSFSALDVELPENVMLLTLSRIGAAAADDDDGTLTLLVRLAHQYA